MKTSLPCLTLLLAACSQPTGASFADRASRADQLETTPSGILFATALMNEQGDGINRLIGQCYASTPDLEKDAFILVADIDGQGEFTNVAVQPETGPSRCYAQGIDRLNTKVSRPAGFDAQPYPVVLKIRYNR